MKISNFLFHMGVIPTPDYVGLVKAPYRDEKNPSLLIYRSGNSFEDYSLATKGGIAEFVELYTHGKVRGVNACLNHFDKIVGNEPKEFDKKYTTFEGSDSTKKTKFKDEFVAEYPNILDVELKNYLRERKIINIPKWLHEVHLKRGKFINKYIGLKNRAGGYNLRNPKFKKGFDKTHIAIAQIGTNGRVVVIEGLFDALSWYQYHKEDTIIILNSTSNIKKFLDMAKKSKAKQFIFALDNGIGGDLAVIRCKIELGEDRAIDYRTKYKEYDDLNDRIRNIKASKDSKRLAYKKGIYYYKANKKSLIVEFEGCSFTQIKKEIFL